MRLLAFSVYDVKAEIYFPPWYARTVPEALRQFEGLINDGKSVLAQNPGDFRLYRCGEFYQDKGVLVGAAEGHVLVEEGLQLVKEA